MEQNVFNAMELDAIGEVMNISLGSSATAVSNLLDHRVDITTPSVSVVPVEEFIIGDLEPAIAIEIKYVSGLEGSNIMLLKREDVKVIVDILMGGETPDEEFEINELTISAVCEVMNQMMGAASTALSDFLGRSVNISTPQSFTLDDIKQFKEDHFKTSDGMLVVVRFTLSIENMLNSEFVNVMSVDLARELLGGFGMDISSLSSEPAPAPASEPAPAPAPEPAPAPAASSGDGGKMSQEEIERLMGGMSAPAPAPAPEPAPAPAASSGDGGKMSQEEIERLMGGMSAPAPAPAPAASSGDGGKMSQEEIERLMGGMSAPAPAPAPAAPAPAPTPAAPAQQPAMQAQPMQGMMPQQMPAGYPGVMPGMMPQQMPMQQPMYYQPDPKVVNAKPLSLPTLDLSKELGEEQAQNLELIMSVPLEVSVEIGRTRRKVEDVLTFSKGSLVVLDKLAGDQVDLFVNGLCVARGDVVVIDDNFGVRITEVLKQPGLMDLAKNL